MFFTSICYRTGARFAKYAQWARHKLSRIQCTQRSRWKAHVLNVGAGRDLSQQTHWSNPRLPSAWRMARARAHAVCSVSVTPFNVAITLPLKKEMNVKKKRIKTRRQQLPPTSDLLAHVEPGLGRGRRVFPHLAGKALGAVAALEDFQAVRAFPPLPGAHLPLPQHWLADLGPEVTGTAVALRAVRRAQTWVALVPCHRKLRGCDS